MATILIVDDHEPSREMLKALFRHSRHVLLEAADGREAKALAIDQKPELIISDIVMPYLDGYQLAYELAACAQMPPVSFILYSATYLPSEAKGLAAACGVRYFLTKPTDPVLLLHTVNEVLKLGPVTRPLISHEEFLNLHSRLVTDKLVEKTAELTRETGERKAAELAKNRMSDELDAAVSGGDGHAPQSEVLDRPLSAREREVLVQLSTGLNNREIGAILFICEGTVKTHVMHIMDKLGVTDRFKAAVWAIRGGLMDLAA